MTKKTIREILEEVPEVKHPRTKLIANIVITFTAGSIMQKAINKVNPPENRVDKIQNTVAGYAIGAAAMPPIEKAIHEKIDRAYMYKDLITDTWRESQKEAKRPNLTVVE